MSILDEVADGLAQRAVKLMDDSGDDTIEARIAQEIGASSPTLQEAFLTAMRLRKAEIRGHVLLDKYAAGDAIPKAGISGAFQD